MNKSLVTILSVVLAFLLIGFCLLFIRSVSLKELDDVSPEIDCSKELLEKGDILWVIPKFDSIPIDENLKWCEYIKGLNKTLAMHGVYHTFEEFGAERDWEYVKEGIVIFENCFGVKPELFKPPQMVISRENKRMLEENGLEVKGKVNQLTHKVYHCSDTGMFSNRFIELF